jgi:hypothetical protein
MKKAMHIGRPSVEGGNELVIPSKPGHENRQVDSKPIFALNPHAPLGRHEPVGSPRPKKEASGRSAMPIF